eukprot:m.167469 g.167469  ORF g.167469 m.167469 type:complete len:68 (-) comp14729_c0_seq4:4477-4680(-)
MAFKSGVAAIEVLAALQDPVIIDVRDPNEVAAGKGGPLASLPGAHHAPINLDDNPQKEHCEGVCRQA